MGALCARMLAGNGGGGAIARPEGVAVAAVVGKPVGHRVLGAPEAGVGIRTEGGLDSGPGLTDCVEADGEDLLGCGDTDCGTGSGARDDTLGGLETTGKSAPVWSWKMACSS